MRRVLLFLCAAVCLSLGSAQTYVYARAKDIGTLDPLLAGSNFSVDVINNLYETLYGYLGTSTELQPVLATSYDASADGLTYTFHLREGVTFHSGNPFSCADVRYTYLRTLIYDPGTLTAAVFEPDAPASWTFDENTPDEAYEAYWAAIDRSVECVGDLTVAFHVLAPDPLMLEMLNSYAYSILDSKVAEANGLWDGTKATWREWTAADPSEYYLQDHEAGTGAYRLVEWVPDVHVMADRYPLYWGPAPMIARVVYEPMGEDADRVAALLSGEADQIDFAGEALTQDELAAKPGVRVLDPSQDPSLSWGLTDLVAVLFNYDITADDNDLLGSGELDGAGIPPDFFTDVDVRKCFSYAFDPESYIEDVLGGRAIRVTMALPPEFPGYDASIPTYGLDPAKAEEHCRAAWGGRMWEVGFTLKVPYPADHTPFDAVTQQLKTSLAALNPKFKVEPTDISWDEYFGGSDMPKAPMKFMGGLFSIPASSAILADWYGPDNSFPASLGFKDDEFASLLGQARDAPDEATRDAIYGRIGRLGYEKAVFLLLPETPEVLVVSDKVSGAYINPARRSLRWADLAKK